MTRQESYREGFALGARWAEEDARNGLSLEDATSAEMRERAQYASEPGRAWALGAMRGYREAWRRIDAGTLTPAMYDLAPVNRPSEIQEAT